MKRVIGCVLAGFAAAWAAAACGRSADDFLRVDRLVAHESAANHVRIYGSRPDSSTPVVILPSLGRGVEDYTEVYSSTLTTRLAEAGYRVVLIQPRGVGRSTGDLTPEHASMAQFARDIKACLDALGIRSAHFVGHAFGNRLARSFATLYPSRVDRLVLMAAGGNFEMSESQKDGLRRSLDLALNDEERLAAIRRAFFAEGSDARVWLRGWYPQLARAQVMASRMANGDFYRRAAGKPFLLIQPMEDFIAPPDLAGRVLKAELGEQVTYVEIQGAGHALAPEQPDTLAQLIVDYLGAGK